MSDLDKLEAEPCHPHFQDHKNEDEDPKPIQLVTELEGRPIRDFPSNSPNEYLCLSILVIFFCSWLLGFIAIIKAIQIKILHAGGYYAQARQVSRTVLKLNLAGFIIGIILNSIVLTYLIFVFQSVLYLREQELKG